MILEYAELHTPLFLNGTNLQTKLDPKKREGLSLLFDSESTLLYVTYKKSRRTRIAMVPMSNVASMVGAEQDEDKEVESKPLAPAITDGKPITAQAETPMSHVFAGLGKGRTK